MSNFFIFVFFIKFIKIMYEVVCCVLFTDRTFSLFDIFQFWYFNIIFFNFYIKTCTCLYCIYVSIISNHILFLLKKPFFNIFIHAQNFLVINNKNKIKLDLYSWLKTKNISSDSL